METPHSVPILRKVQLQFPDFNGDPVRSRQSAVLQAAGGASEL